MRASIIILVLVVLLFGQMGCFIVNEHLNHSMYYPGKFKIEPYIPGTIDCIGDYYHSRPDDTEQLEVYRKHIGRLPQEISSTHLPSEAFELIMSSHFPETEEYVDLAIASLYNMDVCPTAWSFACDDYSSFVRALVFNIGCYSEESHRKIAHVVFCGKHAKYVPANDSLMLYYALVSIYGMDWMNDLLASVYEEHGQVLVPFVRLKEFVPDIIRTVVAKVKNSPFDEHEELLKSIGFAYTGRTMVSTVDMRELYERFPCRSYAHELVERGCFDVLAKEDLWLKYRFGVSCSYLSTWISPVARIKFPLGFEEEQKNYRKIISKEIHQLLVENNVHSPRDLRKFINSKNGIPDGGSISNFKEHPEEFARMLTKGGKDEVLCSEIIDRIVPEKRGELKHILEILKEYCDSDEPYLEYSSALSLMVHQGLLPYTYSEYYFEPCTVTFGRWGWHATNSFNLEGTTLHAILRFFGD